MRSAATDQMLHTNGWHNHNIRACLHISHGETAVIIPDTGSTVKARANESSAFRNSIDSRCTVIVDAVAAAAAAALSQSFFVAVYFCFALIILSTSIAAPSNDEHDGNGDGVVPPVMSLPPLFPTCDVINSEANILIETKHYRPACRRLVI